MFQHPNIVNKIYYSGIGRCEEKKAKAVALVLNQSFYTLASVIRNSATNLLYNKCMHGRSFPIQYRK